MTEPNKTKHPYNSEERCYEDLNLARKFFGDIKTTRVHYNNLTFSLGKMYLECPKKIQTLVWATLFEATWRRFYFEPIWEAAERAKGEG